MSDVERVKQWMAENGYTLMKLSPVIGIPYNTMWRMLFERATISERFAIYFIRTFGCDEAMRILQDTLKRTETPS